MSTKTIKLPAEIMHWVETRVRSGRFASAEDYVSELVARDRDDKASDEERMEALRRLVEDAEASGVSNKTFDDIRAEGERIARERGLL